MLLCIFTHINCRIWRQAAKTRDFDLPVCLNLALLFFFKVTITYLLKNLLALEEILQGSCALSLLLVPQSIVINHSSEGGRNTGRNSSCTTVRGPLIHSGTCRWREHWPGDHGHTNGSYNCTSQLSSEVKEIVQLFITNSKVLRASED